ncbi:aminoglycoside phosphotransferase family protein [Virgibacillus oceani]
MKAIKTLINQIPELNNCKDIIRIRKGFSSDEKYLIHMNDKRLLLRMFKPDDLKQKKQEYCIQEKMRDLHINCSRPVSVGEVGDCGYMLTTYIDGIDAEEEINKYTEKNQFDIGFTAGKELKKMHQLAAPNHVTSWYSRKVKKHKNYIDAYLESGVKVKNDQKIMEYIEKNIHLMKQRPNLFQHDDFHLGNIIVKDKKFAGVIDFNRYDWGDPYHEFLKIGIFSREISIPFSIGQIRGYFNHEEPNKYFWRLYSLYLAMCVFSTVVWSLKFDPDNINDMLDRMYLFLDDHDYFSQVQPRWYETMKF